MVLSVLTSKTTIAEVCRTHGVTETTFNRWREQAPEGIEHCLEDNAHVASSREAELVREVAILERTLGQLAVIADL